MRGIAGLAVLMTGVFVTACSPEGAVTGTAGVIGGESAGRSADAAGSRGSCVVTQKLIPTCGAWWGIAPGVSSVRAVELAERRMGRRSDIVHVHHRGGELFPTSQEREVAKGPRLLLVSWEPAPDRTWAQIAAGAVDRRIDRLADHLTRTFPKRFFLAVQPEPEDDVRPGGGYSAADYVAMYRHVVTRLRARGVRTAVTVMTYTGGFRRVGRPWPARLYPGDDVVDWVAVDSYPSDHSDDLAGLLTSPEHAERPGFYQWAQARFPAKPIMIAEWGVTERPGMSRRKRRLFASVARQIGDYPQIKALVYVDSPPVAGGGTRFATTPGVSRAFGRLARNPRFTATAVPLA